jgi:hypothetical protein
VYDQLVAKTNQLTPTDGAVDDELFFLDRKGWEKKKEGESGISIIPPT